jgi:hypothetical protein
MHAIVTGLQFDSDSNGKGQIDTNAMTLMNGEVLASMVGIDFFKFPARAFDPGSSVIRLNPNKFHTSCQHPHFSLSVRIFDNA